MKTIVLIHGLWMTPHCWSGFRSYYRDKGYRVLAPGWPGMIGDVADVRHDPSAFAHVGLGEIAAHYEKFIHSIGTQPLLIGHSMGGLIVQMLLDRGLGTAGVSIDGTVPKGVYRLPLSVLKAASPVLSNPLNAWRNVTLTFEQFKYAFANVMTDDEAMTVYQQEVVPGPGRPVFQAALANMNPRSVCSVNHRNAERAPLLLISADRDHLVPAVLNRINYKLYQRSTAVTAYKEFPDRSHLIIAQKGWQEVAQYALTWAEMNARLTTVAPDRPDGVPCAPPAILTALTHNRPLNA
ncbi:MAG: putative arylesterase-like protein [Verrucomicrobiaceae bacterium]|nr:putative arylesterase-like protein [Verrucomicrobiaceae bacterium]